MKAKNLWRHAFRAGISVKGFDGALETIGGVLLWFIKPSSFTWMETFWRTQLSRHPQNVIAFHLLHESQRLAGSDPAFASFYLLGHGLAKVILAIALWLDKLWAYPLAISIFGGFCVYQIYRYTHTHSQSLLVLTAFDVAVVFLTWREYRTRKSEGGARVGKVEPVALAAEAK